MQDDVGGLEVQDPISGEFRVSPKAAEIELSTQLLALCSLFNPFLVLFSLMREIS